MHRKCHVLENGHLREEAEILEHNAELAAVVRDLKARKRAQLIVADRDLSGCGSFFTQKKLHHGRFSGSGMTYDEDELSVLDMKIHAVECKRTVRVGFFYVVEIYHDQNLTGLVVR